MPDYDAIVIGAGNGGLTAAVTLAQKNQKVLLLEQHNIPGGCATSFVRGRFEFETSLHQLSGIGSEDNPGPLRATFENLGILDKVEFVYDDYLYRSVISGKYDIMLNADRPAAAETLKSNFPKESNAIDKFFDLVSELMMQYLDAVVMQDPEFSKKKYPIYTKYFYKNAADVLDEFFEDLDLKAVLASYWVYFGLPPSKLSFIQLVLVLWTYMEYKPSHVKGGSQAISNALLDTFLKAGGDVCFSCGAGRIIVSNGKVKGVVTENGDEISTNSVISNAGNLKTYIELIDPEHIPSKELKLLRQRTIGNSVFCVYLGLDCEHQELGIESSANFVCNTIDFDAHYAAMRTFEKPAGFGITCYDAVHPEFSPPGTCQLVVISLHYLDPWLTIPSNRYAETKYQYAQKFLEAAEQVYPGLNNHIEEMEIATPLTFMRYLRHPGGAVYGFAQHSKDNDIFPTADSPISGLYFSGAWMGFGGFMPTYESGIQAAEIVLNSLEQK